MAKAFIAAHFTFFKKNPINFIFTELIFIKRCSV